MGMRGAGFVALLLAAAVAAAQEAPREVQVPPLGCSVAVPFGWKVDQAATGMVARDAQDNGFMVTREPFLHDPDTFAATWKALLGAARNDARVERAKAGSRDAWHATWSVGERRIEVWRLYAPESEMLYNISFSAAKGFDLKPLVDTTLKSFKCAAAKPELKFQPNGETVSPRIQIRIPEGFEKEELGMGFMLGGGISGGFVKVLPGYEPPHVAARLRFQGRDAGTTYITEDGQQVPGNDVEKIIDMAWSRDSREFAQILKKPRSKETTFSGIKGCAMEASVLAKSGLPLRWMAFVGKHKQDVVQVVVVADEREVRLCKDLLKQVCSNLVVAR
jgi:hypothetical protein